jgi:hypothetical protein
MRFTLCYSIGVVAVLGVRGAIPASAADPFVDGQFNWRSSSPLVSPDRTAADAEDSIKDPSIVRYKDRWHLFSTLRTTSGKVDIEYRSFADWKDADKVPRHRLNMHDQYYCAPQVFYFRPQKKWYLIYQIADKNHRPPFGPAFSTTTTLDDPKSWSRPQWLYPEGSPKHKWIDFWVICDREKAHLFYTSNDGHMWRAETKLAYFPGGWSEPILTLQGDIFEASHTYKLKDQDKYLTIVEAVGDARRYYKAYLADRLEGPWRGLADRRDKPFASVANVTQDKAWTTNISHGELFRTGTDETMEVDPQHLRFLYQGASDAEYRGHPYAKIPWRLGILELKL